MARIYLHTVAQQNSMTTSNGWGLYGKADNSYKPEIIEEVNFGTRQCKM